jgi:bla regulator protein blaR1
MSAELLRTLLETTLAGSAAILLVLALRAPLASRFGAHAGYLLWVLVPLSMLAVMLPPRVVETIVASSGAVGAIAAEPTLLPVSPSSSWPMAVLITWMTGAMLMLAWQALQQRRFVYSLGPLRKRAGFHHAARSPGLPAVVGAVNPRLILPPDFRSRYSRAERRLVLHHERVHLCRGDLAINLFVLLLRCLYWFNPLFVLASRRFRQDQELACDQSVIARYPHERRTYGDAMLKTHLASQALPLGCHWNGNHPLKERIAMLKRPTLTRRQRWLGALVATTLAVASGFAAWAAQPENVVARAASGPLYRVQLQLHVDGETSRMEVVTPAAVPFAVATDSPRGRSWRGEFTLQPEQRRDHVRLSGTISESGKPVSTPAMVMALGKPANLKVGETGAASAFSIDVVATAVPPPPAPAPPPPPAAPDAPPASVRGAQFAPVPPVYPSAAAKNHQSGSWQGQGCGGRAIRAGRRVRRSLARGGAQLEIHAGDGERQTCRGLGEGAYRFPGTAATAVAAGPTGHGRKCIQLERGRYGSHQYQRNGLRCNADRRTATESCSLRQAQSGCGEMRWLAKCRLR